MAYMDTNSGLYKLAVNSQNVSTAAAQKKAANVDVTGAGAAKYASAEAQQQAATQAQRQQNAQIVGQYMAALAQRQAAANGSTPTTNAANETAQTAPAAATGGSSGGRNVTYVDDNGERQTGVITGTAEQESTETPETAETELDYWEKMKHLYAQMYAEAVEANDAQAAAASERAAAAAQEQLDALAAQYAGTNRQLYRDYMTTQKNLAQQMSAQGYSGGMSESARLRLGTSYQEALAENERARIAAAAGISSEQAQNIYEIEAAAAEANRTAAQQQNQYLLALEQERYQYEQALQQARAEQMAAAGDFSAYLDLGYSQAEVDYLTRIWLLENPSAQSAWIAAHPTEAARLGLTGTYAAAASSGYNGGGSGGSSGGTVSQEKKNQYTEILQVQAAANDMLRDGASTQQVQNELAGAAASGEISYAAALAASQSVSNPTAGLTTSELNAASAANKAASTGTKKTYNSVAEAGSLWTYLFENPTVLSK